MKPTNAFNRHNTAGFQSRYRRLQRLFFLRPLIRAEPLKMRAARRTGNGLGMEATIIRVTILFVALRTEWERRHHGERAVIGHGADNRKAWTTVGAVDKGVSVATFAGGIHFNKAFGTSRGIRNDLRIHRTASTLTNREIGRLLRPGDCFALNAVNARQRWAVLM